MCGIVGLISPNINSETKLKSEIMKMSNRISHRGPDSDGFWLDVKNNLALGHKRLSILDLSSNGNQPMISSNRRYVIVFNGEIYNHLQIRKYIVNSNINWKGNSDTETLLEAINILGIKKALNLCIGMFAFGLWDTQEKTLTLVRDRFGEKPLYYGWVNNCFVFSSELKSIKSLSGFNNKVSRNAIAQYLQFNYIPSPLSIYENIYKLEKSKIIYLKPTLNKVIEIKSERYWSLDNIIKKSKNKMLTDEKETIKLIKNSIKDSVKLQMISDVPIGSFLSGGIDSSLITAMMQEQSFKSISTFTVGFEEFGFDESLYAKKISNHLKTNHNEIFIKSQEALDVIPNLSSIYDEPFSDSSQIPTFLLSKFAKNDVTVILSGDGADEIFGGYNRYTLTPIIWAKISILPFPIRRAIGSVLSTVPIQLLDLFGAFLNSFLSDKKKISRFGDKIHKMSRRFEVSSNLDEFNYSFSMEWDNVQSIFKEQNEKEGLIKKLNRHKNLNLQSPTERMMYQDINHYMTDDILCKVDRASMANSLETRIPFLNHNLVEMSWRVPENLKIKNQKGKWILREILKTYIPENLYERPKTGFSIPLAQWLRGPLREWADSLINKKMINEQGYFYFENIKKMWLQHLTGRYDWSSRLWCILILQSWLNEETRKN
tara:strand:- start:2426 stop:4396 length:1971 start_codon:yes stop_codon:yes gene_type:complete